MSEKSASDRSGPSSALSADSPMFRQEIDLGLGRVLKLLEAAGSPHEYLAPKVVSTEEFAVLVFVKHFM